MPAFKRVFLASLVVIAIPIGSGRAFADPIIPNGNFSQGFSGFSSGYSYRAPADLPNATLLGPEGTFSVGTNPALFHNLWGNFGDHTTGSGDMLIVNGHFSPDVVVWSSMVEVEADTEYDFSAWIASTYPENPSTLAFSINGALLGSTLLASNTPGVWQQYSASWYSGTTRTALLTLVDLNTVRSGNDFAVDDISLTGRPPVLLPAPPPTGDEPNGPPEGGTEGDTDGTDTGGSGDPGTGGPPGPSDFPGTGTDGTDGGDMTVVPEPTSMLLFGSGLVGLAGMLKRRNRK